MGGAMQGGHALEVGCGRGVGAKLVLDMFGADRVDGFDLDPHMVGLANRRLRPHGDRVRLWVGDVTRLPKADATYDAVFDFGIIHHVPNWRDALKEVYRVLKPGGRFYAEEVLVDYIMNPFWRILLDHPMEDRFLLSLGFDCWVPCLAESRKTAATLATQAFVPPQARRVCGGVLCDMH